MRPLPGAREAKHPADRTAAAGSASGLTLVEVLVAMVLLTMGLLGIAPLFGKAIHGNARGGELGTVASKARERMEQLRAEEYDDLVIGGSLTVNQTGYFDDSDAGYEVRWEITDGVTPADTRIVRVRVRKLSGLRADVTLVTRRAR